VRSHALLAATAERFDLLVIGAGINGAGIARDAAMRGLRVLLVDKGDLGSGTTSWSTRLIHGGLRYLEHFEGPLVRESLRERETLMKIAGHLVKPVSMAIPIYEGDRRGPAIVRLGMVTYDVLSLGKSLDNHRMLSAAEALEREPGLSPEGLRGAALYHDAQVEFAERLAVENALAARTAGAVVLTYARAERLVIEENVVRGVELSDVLNASSGVREARAEVVVNAAGPWVDEVLSTAARRPRRMVGGTKGSHLVVESFAGAPRDALYVEASADGRPYFIVPWNGLFLIGTTDERYSGDLDWVVADDAEIDYLIAETNRVVPEARLTRQQVIYTYAGVRPLPYVRGGDTGGVTRRHIVHDHAPDLAANLVSIVGGKLTTYRSLAEEAVDEVYRLLARRRPGSRTGKVRLPGGSAGRMEEFAASFAATSGLGAGTSARLVRVYGTRAEEIAQIAASDESLAHRIADEPGTVGAEVLYAVRHEAAETLTDILMRRTMIGLGPSVGIGPDREAADIAMRWLGWDAERAEREVDAFRAYIERYRPRRDASPDSGGSPQRVARSSEKPTP
jgi:glycerol-3-phosphate dehydrogenase